MVCHPVVKVSIVDASNGMLLHKSGIMTLQSFYEDALLNKNLGNNVVLPNFAKGTRNSTTEDTNNRHYLFFHFLYDAWNNCTPEQYHFGKRRG